MSENQKRSSISSSEFLNVYVEMANNGSTSKEIADRLSTQERLWSSDDVIQRASSERLKLRNQLRSIQETRNLSESQLAKVEEFIYVKVPKLKSRLQSNNKNGNNTKTEMEEFLESISD